MKFENCYTLREILAELKELEAMNSSTLDLPFVLTHNPSGDVCDDYGIDRTEVSNRGFASMMIPDLGEHSGKYISRIEPYVFKDVEKGYAVVGCIKPHDDFPGTEGLIEKVFVSETLAYEYAQRRNDYNGNENHAHDVVRVVECDISKVIGYEAIEKIRKGER